MRLSESFGTACEDYLIGLLEVVVKLFERITV